MQTILLVLVVATRKKLNRAPMQTLIKYLEAHPKLCVLQLDEVGMNQQPVEEWPIAHVFLPLVSEKFPLERALSYATLRCPLVVNDLNAHVTLRDRIATRQLLRLRGIPVANGVIFDGDAGDCRVLRGDTLFVYTNTGLLRGSVRKPFVEKPADAENHEVFIYYPGKKGARRLHRKVGDSSSQYLPNVFHVRSGNAYVYEQFHAPVMCADVKVYSAGNYFYAEARKAPHIDGHVERDEMGLEKRTRVKLSDMEMVICQRVTESFGQFLNGFDLLRTKDGRTFVIDVNGWSFVKRANEFAPNCASKLIAHILAINNCRVNRYAFHRPCIDSKKSNNEPPSPTPAA